MATSSISCRISSPKIVENSVIARIRAEATLSHSIVGLDVPGFVAPMVLLECWARGERLDDLGNPERALAAVGTT
jgi:hypothetical protein